MKVSFPTAAEAVITTVPLNKLDSLYKKPAVEQKTLKFQLIAYAVGAVATVVFTAMEAAANLALAVVQTPFAVLNATIGRLTGLNRHLTSSALFSSEDLWNRAVNIRRTFIIMYQAIGVLFLVQPPKIMQVVGREVGLIQVAPNKNWQANFAPSELARLEADQKQQEAKMKAAQEAALAQASASAPAAQSQDAPPPVPGQPEVAPQDGAPAVQQQLPPPPVVAETNVPAPSADAAPAVDAAAAAAK